MKYQGVKNHFGGSFASISPHVVIILPHVKLSIHLGWWEFPKFGQKMVLNQYGSSMCYQYTVNVNIKEWRITLVVGYHQSHLAYFTSCKIIFLISRGDNTQNPRQKQALTNKVTLRATNDADLSLQICWIIIIFINNIVKDLLPQKLRAKWSTRS